MNKQSMKTHMRERFSGESKLSTTPPLPNSLNIEINNTCNQRCIYCAYHGKYALRSLNGCPSVMKKDMVKRILKQAWELGIGRKELGLYFSGEALLHPDLVELVSYAKELGFPYIFLTSNGALASIDKMKSLISAGLNSIRFSVNAADSETYRIIHGRDDFDNVYKNIRDLKEYIVSEEIDLSTSISCVITKKTSDIQEKMCSIFEKYVDELLFIPLSLSNLEPSREFIEEYAFDNQCEPKDASSEFVCPLIFNTMYIDASGQVFPCCEGSFYKIAKLEEEFDLEAIWHNQKMKELREIFIGGRSDRDTICSNCLLRKEGIDAYMFSEE